MFSLETSRRGIKGNKETEANPIRKKPRKQRMSNKMVYTGVHTSEITVNLNELYSPIQSQIGKNWK